MVPAPLRSVQAPLLDEIIWSRLSRFWTDVMDISDRAAFETIYEAGLSVIDAEFVRLLQIDQAKSVATCPIFMQRRWLRLDLNHYFAVKSWLEYLSGRLTHPTNPTDTEGEIAQCLIEASTALHWHVRFPWRVVSDAALSLGLPLLETTVQIWKMDYDSQGRLVGRKLLPIRDYTVDYALGRITMPQAVVGDQYEIEAAPLLPREMNGFAYTIDKADPVDGTNIAVTNFPFLPGYPVHVCVVRHPPAETETNDALYQTTREFYAYTGDIFSGGTQHGASNQVLLPPTVVLSNLDAVYVFGVIEGGIPFTHRHMTDSLKFSAANANPSNVASIPLTQVPSAGAYGCVDLFPQEFNVVVGGRLLHPSEYRYDLVQNRIFFKTPLTFSPSSFLLVQVHYTVEESFGNNPIAGVHIHRECTLERAVTPVEYERFDDGGILDDHEIVLDATFDQMSPSNVVVLEFPIETDGYLMIFVDGDEQFPGVHYSVSVDGNRTKVAFSASIQGRAVDILTQRVSLVYPYTWVDMLSGRQSFGITTEVLERVINNVTPALTGFQQLTGYTDVPPAVLLEAAKIAAAGGNPFFALFLDEFPELEYLGLDAAGAAIPATTARALESADTKLIAIPYLVDRVHNPVSVLSEGVHYQTQHGGLESAVDLLTPRSDKDDAPGVWWCPLVVLDERTLAKNFGALVQHFEDSSLEYRDALAAQLHLCFNGPDVAQLQRAACALLGSRLFTQDGTVQKISTKASYRELRILDPVSHLEQVVQVAATDSAPSIGTQVSPRQSLMGRRLYNDRLTSFETWVSGTLTLTSDLALPDGTVVHLQLYPPGSAIPTWAALTVTRSQVTPTVFGIRYTIFFAERPVGLEARATSWMRAYEDAGAPYSALEGYVSNSRLLEYKEIATDKEAFDLPPGVEPSWAVGAAVVAGDPVRKDLAQVYDSTVRPNWQWQTPQQMLLNIAQAAARSYQQQATLTPTGTGLTRAVFYSAVPRGTVVMFRAEGAQETQRFLVRGSMGSEHWMEPEIADTLSGIATWSDAPANEVNQFFEEPLYAAIEPAVAPDQRVLAPSLVLTSAAGLPDAGRVRLRTPAGGSLAVSYLERHGALLIKLTWDSDLEAFRNPGTGELDLSIPAGTTARVLTRYRSRRLNPAFVAAVTRRVIHDPAGRFGQPVLATDADADAYFAVIGNSTAVIETGETTAPARLAAVFDRLVPVGATVILISQQRISETFDPTLLEGLPIADQLRILHPMVIALTSDPAPVGGIITLAGNRSSVAITLVVTDIDHPTGPWSTEWIVRATRGGTDTLRIEIADSTCAIYLSGLIRGGEYAVQYKLENPSGQTQSGAVTVVVP